MKHSKRHLIGRIATPKNLTDASCNRAGIFIANLLISPSYNLTSKLGQRAQM